MFASAAPISSAMLPELSRMTMMSTGSLVSMPVALVTAHVSPELPPLPPESVPAVMMAPVPPLALVPPFPFPPAPDAPLEPSPPLPTACPAGPEEALHASEERMARTEIPALRRVIMAAPIHVEGARSDHGLAQTAE